MSNLSCIGLAVDDQDQFGELMGKIIAGAVDDLVSTGATHPRWTDPSGASVAFHLEEQSIACLTPYFAAASPALWRVRTHAPADDPECTHCGGADCDLLDADGEMVTRATVQWLQYQPYREWLGSERTFTLEVVGFAQTASFYDDSAAFEADQAAMWGDAKGPDDKPLRLAENAFMPEGMFAGDGAMLSERAVVLMVGLVVQVTLLKNAVTNNGFVHVRIDTLPGLVDVVLDPASVPAAPRAGQLASVRAWLVGRPTEPPPAVHKRPVLRSV